MGWLLRRGHITEGMEKTMLTWATAWMVVKLSKEKVSFEVDAMWFLIAMLLDAFIVFMIFR